MIHRSVKVREYLHLTPKEGIALVGQPVPQYYFDRPLHELLAPFFAADLTMDAIEEPAFP